jgi:hypothetical protein
MHYFGTGYKLFLCHRARDTSVILDPALVSAVYSELLESAGFSYTCLSKVVSARPWHRNGNLITVGVCNEVENKESSIVCLCSGADGPVTVIYIWVDR